MNIQPPQQAPSKAQQYFLGLGLGLIPLVPILITLLTNGPIGGLFSGLLLYIIEIIATIGTLTIKRVRSVGFGLLTMVLISPLVFVIGFFIALRLHPPSFEWTLTPREGFLLVLGKASSSDTPP
jgi:hypothetical protein